MANNVPTRDIILYERTPESIFIDIDRDTEGNALTEDDLSGLTFTARHASARSRQAVLETALGHVSGTTFLLAISASDMATIKDGWVCDVFRDDTGKPILQLDFEVKSVVLNNPNL